MSSVNLAVGLLCGCGLGLLLLARYPGGLHSGPGFFLILLALCACGCALLGRRDRRALWASLLVAWTLAGGGRALITHPPFTLSDLAYHITPSEADSSEIEVIGIVAAEPLLGDRSQRLRISAESIPQQASQIPFAVKGDLLAILPRYPEYSLGERLKLTGAITAPPTLSDFDYAAWLARQGVHSYMSFPRALSMGRGTDSGFESLVAAARARARHTLQRNVAEPQASIAVGVVIGDRTALSDEVREAFQRTGTTHILAISGQNIMLLVGLVWLAWSGRKRVMPMWLALLTISALALYTLFTGASPPVVRAAVMGAILLLGPLLRRRYDPIAALAVTGAVMVLLDPDLLADAGFQLSFLSMWGITTLARPIHTSFTRIKVPGALSYPLSIGLAAQAATVPLVVLLYKQLSLVSLLATLTADITLLPLMLSGIITAALGLLPWDALAWIGGWAVWFCSGWLLWWVEWWAQLPWASIQVEGFHQLYAIAYYAALFAGVWLFSHERRREKISSLRLQLSVAALGAAAAAVWVVVILLVVVR